MSGEAWYLVDAIPPSGAFVLGGPEGRHAATVRRTRVGERVVLTDGSGGRSVAEATAVDPRAGTATLSVVAAELVPRRDLRVTVVQALPKGERGDLAVELLTEAGADAIVPWQAARCVARWTAGKAERGAAKWRTVAREAGKQSRRAWLPEVRELIPTAGVVELIAASDIACVLHETGSVPFSSITAPAVGEMVLVVGPEGGIDPAELAAFTAAGATAVRLGDEVLRTSTAGAVALGALGAVSSRWG